MGDGSGDQALPRAEEPRSIFGADGTRCTAAFGPQKGWDGQKN